MTEKEKLELIKEKYPNYRDVFSQSELDSLVRELDDPEKLTLFRERGVTQILGGAALGGLGAGAVKGAQAVKGLAKAVTSRKAKTTAAEATGEAVKKRKIITPKRVIGAAAVATGINIIDSLFGGDEEQVAAQEKALEEQTTMNTQLQFAQMQASGIDTEALLSTPAGQQILKNPNFNARAILGTGVMPNIGMTGVYVGGETQVRRRKPTLAEQGSVSLTEWKQQFPIANPTELNKWKKTLVDAGVVSASAGLSELQKQWEAWGQESINASRLGQKLSPYDLLNIQRGLWGGGTGGPSYQVQLMKEENSKALFKQGIEALTGRIVDDAQAEEFAKLVTKKQLKTPTKTETKTVGGKRVSVTTPGFGESEAAALVKKRAQEDPMFAEFQTANVFGSALEKALGVRG
jgi:hypothetical protein